MKNAYEDATFFRNIIVLNLHEFDENTQEFIVRSCYNLRIEILNAVSSNLNDFFSTILGSPFFLKRIDENTNKVEEIGILSCFVSFHNLCAVLTKRELKIDDTLDN